MMYMYPTQTTFIYLFLPSLFSHPPVSSPFPSNIFFFPPLTILFLLQLFLFTQKTVFLHHSKDKKKEIYYTQNIYIYIYIWEEEEACISCGFMGLCWNWILHICFRILQSVWLVRSWRKWKERRTINTCTVRFFFWASCNWGGGSIECREILLLHDFFFNEILVKLGFQNKNKGSLGIMLKMTSGNMISIFAFSTL